MNKLSAAQTIGLDLINVKTNPINIIQQPSSLTLVNTHIMNNMITVQNNQQEVFRISAEGEVFWLKDGILTKVECDTEISKMFSDVITNLAGISPSSYRQKIKEEVKKEFYDNMPLKMKRQYKIHNLNR